MRFEDVLDVKLFSHRFLRVFLFIHIIKLQFRIVSFFLCAKLKSKIEIKIINDKIKNLLLDCALYFSSLHIQ